MYTPEDFDEKAYDTTNHDTTGNGRRKSGGTKATGGTKAGGGKNSPKKDFNTYDHKKPNVSAGSAENYSVLNTSLFM